MTNDNMMQFLRDLGYSFENRNPPVYSFALALKKLGMSELKIVQLVSLHYPLPLDEVKF